MCGVSAADSSPAGCAGLVSDGAALMDAAVEMAQPREPPSPAVQAPPLCPCGRSLAALPANTHTLGSWCARGCHLPEGG